MADRSTINKFAVDFLAGGIAGSISRTCVSPFERIKIIFQLREGKGQGIVLTLKDIWNKEGMRGMFKGNGTNIIRIFPYSAVQFASYELAKKALRTKNSDNSLDSYGRMLAGAFAGICSVITTYPLDLIRTRLSVLNTPDTTINGSIIQCGTNVLKKEGGFFALYRGLSPTLAGIAPYVALNFTVYEGLKSYAFNHGWNLDVDIKLVCGGVAGAVAQTVTYPFDVLRRRMQMTQSKDSPFKYKNSFDAIAQIVKKEGVRAFYKGLVPNYLKVVPAISISFVSFELIKKMID